MFKKAKAIANKLRFSNNHEEEVGLTPGKLVFIGEQKQSFTKITLLGYRQDDFVEVELSDVSEYEYYALEFDNIWINIDGVHDVNEIQKICNYFKVHLLVQEDLVHTGQTSKLDLEEEFLFAIAKNIKFNVNSNLFSEQISIYLNNEVLLTFQEATCEILNPVRNSIRKKIGGVREKKLDYLMYNILDLITDNYNKVIHHFGHKIEDLEDDILINPNEKTLKEINNCKLELNFFRKTIRPMRLMILDLDFEKTTFIAAENQPYFDDLEDGINRAFESAESYKSMLIEQLTVYSISVSNKMNDIMKILTIFSAIFIPLTFISGIYGTNFDHIPELHYKHSYFIMLGIMFFITIVMLVFFKFKKWF